MWWQVFIDWLFYKCIQQNYPKAGSPCTIGPHEIQYVVVSNTYGNRAIVLKELHDEPIYLLISYYFMNGWVPWPIWVFGYINSDGSVSQGYILLRHKMVSRGSRIPLSKTVVCNALQSFDAICTKFKSCWFRYRQPLLLQSSDWNIEAERLNHAARIIQGHWRKCISCPFYYICKNRLVREIDELTAN